MLESKIKRFSSADVTGKKQERIYRRIPLLEIVSANVKAG